MIRKPARKRYSPRPRAVARHRVSVRHKVVLRRTKIALVFCGAALLLFLGGAGLWRMRGAAARHLPSSPEWSKWRLHSINTAGVPKDQALDVMGAVGIKPGSYVSASAAALLENRLAAQFPALRNVRVSRNWLTKELCVTAERRTPLASVRLPGGVVNFIDERGALYAVEPSSASANLLSIEAPQGITADSINPQTLALVRTMRESSSEFPSRPVLLSVDRGEREMALSLADGSRIFWGGAQYTMEKIARLTQVYSNMRARFAGPYQINMRYFEDGRIILSRLDGKPQ